MKITEKATGNTGRKKLIGGYTIRYLLTKWHEEREAFLKEAGFEL